jgi:hypothetical protein
VFRRAGGLPARRSPGRLDDTPIQRSTAPVADSASHWLAAQFRERRAQDPLLLCVCAAHGLVGKHGLHLPHVCSAPHPVAVMRESGSSKHRTPLSKREMPHPPPRESKPGRVVQPAVRGGNNRRIFGMISSLGVTCCRPARHTSRHGLPGQNMDFRMKCCTSGGGAGVRERHLRAVAWIPRVWHVSRARSTW